MGPIFAYNVIASTILDRLLHHSTTIEGESYRLKDKDGGVVAAKLPGKAQASSIMSEIFLR